MTDPNALHLATGLSEVGVEISDLHDQPDRVALLALNNASAQETSLLTKERFDQLVGAARIALYSSPHGLGRLLYAHVFQRATQLGHNTIVCEVNLQPPNSTSDRFHAALGFEEVGRATIDNGAKTVRYLSVTLGAKCAAKT